MLTTKVARRSVMAAAFGIIAVLAQGAFAQSPTAESFTATTAGLTPGSGETLDIDLLRWSTDAERDQLMTAFGKTQGKDWAKDLQAAPSVGYVWPSGREIGYSIKFAQRFPAANGGERVVIVTDRPLGSFDRPAWKATTSPTDYAFSVIELHLTRLGQGEGKASLAGAVGLDAQAKVVALSDYAAAPTLLKVTRRTTTTARPASVAAASTPKPTRAAAARPAAPAQPAAPAGK